MVFKIKIIKHCQIYSKNIKRLHLIEKICNIFTSTRYFLQNYHLSQCFWVSPLINHTIDYKQL